MGEKKGEGVVMVDTGNKGEAESEMVKGDRGKGLSVRARRGLSSDGRDDRKMGKWWGLQLYPGGWRLQPRERKR